MSRIFIVDDEPEIALEIADGLAIDSYESDTATCAARALSTITHSPGRYAVLISDVRMPGMDGITLCREILLMPEAVRPEIVLISGHGMPKQIAAELPDGNVTVVRKPFQWEELLACVAAGCARARARGLADAG